MRITKLTLKNWGPHESLDIDMDTPVFGLLGPNASGKTNILEAIEFAFNGTTERNQAMYVRQVDGEEINNGTVEAHFIKGGVKGRIWRQVGKSPGRKLWWENDGKPITKAAEVDKLMSSILDCDKKAISQSVFLTQGHLADFLMSLPAKREEDFARMCLVDNLSLVADIAAQESLRLQKTVADLTSQRDEAFLAKEQAESALRTVESELELHPDRSALLEWVNRRAEIGRRLRQQQTAQQTCLAVLTSAKERQASVVRPDWIAGDLDQLLETLRTDGSAAQLAKGQASSLRADLARLQLSTARRASSQTELMTILGRASRLSEVQTRLTELSADLTTIAAYQQHRTGYDAYQQQLTAAQQDVANGEQAMTGLPTEAELMVVQRRCEAELEGLAPRKFQLLLAREAEGHVSGCCPLCSGTDLSKLPTGPALKDAQAQWEVESSRNAEELRGVQENRRKIQTWGARLDTHRERLSTLQKSPASPWMTTVPDVDQAPALEQESRKMTAERNELQAEMLSVPRLNQEISQLQELITSSPTVAELDAQLLVCDTTAANLPRLTEQLGQATSYQSTLTNHLRAVTDAQAQLEQTCQLTIATEMDLHTNWKQKPASTLLLAETADELELTRVLQDLRERQAERERVQGMIRANVDALRRSETRIQEIEERARKNAATQSVIGHLEDLRQAFGRQGISRHYLSKVFDALVGSTQENLTDWDTDFQVEKDEATLFNFLFYRTDSPNTMMDQSQLSGGQRTRLALSFVRAVQQLLYPGLDFMCVDEPSNHLDAEGVEGLVRLFQTIAHQNEAGEAQVIVVDHNPLLQRAFSKSLTLSRTNND